MVEKNFTVVISVWASCVIHFIFVDNLLAVDNLIPFPDLFTNKFISFMVILYLLSSHKVKWGKVRMGVLREIWEVLWHLAALLSCVYEWSWDQCCGESEKMLYLCFPRPQPWSDGRYKFRLQANTCLGHYDVRGVLALFFLFSVPDSRTMFRQKPRKTGKS